MKLISIFSVGVATVGMSCLLGYASAANSAPGDLIADATMAPGGRQGGTAGETGRADKGTPNGRKKQGAPGDTIPGKPRPETESPTPKTIKGDLLKIDGEFYVVKDMAGKEIRLHADKTTVLDGAIKAGDQVEVQATEPPRPYKSGFVDHAVSIKHVQPTN